jgi:hypothetical protein
MLLYWAFLINLLLIKISIMKASSLFVAGLLLCCIGFNAIAQRSINIYDHLLIRDSNRALYGEPAEVYEGSPFLNDAFTPGFVYLGEERSAKVPIRYNIHADVMEFEEGGSRYVMEPNNQITKIEIGDHRFVVEAFLPKKQNGFFELLGEGKLTILAKKAVNHRKNDEMHNIPAKYARLPDTYYYKIENGIVTRMSSLKNLIRSLPDKQDQVSKYAEEEKITVKDPNDLLKLANFYNSLFAAN